MSHFETISPIRISSAQSGLAEAGLKNKQAKVETSSEASMNTEYISDLKGMYLASDKGVFTTANAEGRKSFKKLKDIEREIDLILVHEGLDKEKFKDVLNRIHFDIHRLNTLKSVAKDPLEQVQIINQVAAKYQQLLEAVATFINTKRVENEQLGVIKSGSNEYVEVNESAKTADIPTNESTEQQPETLEALKTLKEVYAAYLDRLKEYYENQSLIGGVSYGSKNTLGLNPTLPVDLQQLRDSYLEARTNYFIKLSNERDIDSDEDKYNFGTEFVLSPHRELLDSQELLLAGKEERHRFRKLSEAASQYPNLAMSIGLTAMAGDKFAPNTKPDSELNAQEALDDVAVSGEVEATTEAEELLEVEVSEPAQEVTSEFIEEEQVIRRPYTVQKGNTIFWTIIEEQFAEDLRDLPARKKLEILDTLFERVQSNSELKDSLGIRSGDIELIYPGEEINLADIESELDKILYGEEIATNYRKAAPLNVEVDSETKVIPIKMVPVETIEVVETVVASTNSWTKEGDTKDTIGSHTPKKGPLPEVEQASALPPKSYSVDGNYFDQPDYKNFIESTFGSVKAFERIIDKVVEGIDNSSYDIFNRGMYASPYYFMNEMSLEEIDKFQNLPNSELRYILQTNNIKYDTYLAWLDKVDEMKVSLPHESETTLADMFSRYVAESKLYRSNILTKKV